jgi:hypothetical protein
VEAPSAFLAPQGVVAQGLRRRAGELGKLSERCVVTVDDPLEGQAQVDAELPRRVDAVAQCQSRNVALRRLAGGKRKGWM